MSHAAARLARSRQAIVEQMAPSSQRPDRGEPGGWFARVRAAASTWWRHHPARLGVALATPLLSKYAARSPWWFLAMAAASGALVAVAHPWRLLSVSGVLVAVAKSSKLPGLLLSALAAVDGPRAREHASGQGDDKPRRFPAAAARRPAQSNLRAISCDGQEPDRAPCKLRRAT